MKLTVLCAILLRYFIEVNTDLAFQKVFDDLHTLPPPPKINSRSTVDTRWIKQRLDNFNRSDTRTWSMRYMVNNNYFKNGSPIFIFVGGEWEISPGYIQGGHMFDIAKELNGYMIYTEHRYYGESKPTPDLSIENMKYLNVDQALADLAHFILTMKMRIRGLRKSGVILVGGSYSATMVTWFREKYPALACGAWASSAPVLAKIDFLEYKEVTGQSIKLVGGQNCYDRIQNAFQKMEGLLENNKTDELKKNLLICDNLDLSNQLDVWSMFSSLSDIFAGLVQGQSAGDIENACKRIMAEDDDVAGVSAYVKNYFGNPSNCVDYSYKSLVNQLSSTEYSSSMRQWVYQTCTEYGWFQTSASKAQPFGTKFPVDLYIQMCKDVYGDRYTSDYVHQNADKTNFKYGGMNPKVTDVYFTHGQLDPWHAMGIQKDLNQYAEATIVPLYAHCKDLGSLDNNTDTDQMITLKKNVKSHMYQWLGIKE